MQLTLQYKTPGSEVLKCSHCDEPIEKKEVYKYVKCLLGEQRANFHDECFYAVKVAIDRFYEIFIELKYDKKVLN